MSALRGGAKFAIFSNPTSRAVSSVCDLASTPIDSCECEQAIESIDLLPQLLRSNRPSLGVVATASVLVVFVASARISSSRSSSSFDPRRAASASRPLSSFTSSSASRRSRIFASVPAMASDDEASSLRRIRAVRCRCRSGREYRSRAAEAQTRLVQRCSSSLGRNGRVIGRRSV